jgi:hypothetical protein
MAHGRLTPFRQFNKRPWAGVDAIDFGATKMKAWIGFVVMFAMLVVLAAPAFASECTSLMAKIEEKLASAEITKPQEAKIVELLEKGEELHEAGEHEEAVKVLKQALSMLGG